MATTRRQVMAATAALLASGRAGALPAQPAPLSPRVKLTLGANTVPHVSPFLSIADTARPLGLDIEVVKFERYADTRTALASGSIDMGSVGPADVPIALSQGLKTVVALMGVGISPKNPIVAKNFSPGKWEDFAGKRVGVAPGSAVWFQFAATLIEAGFPYSKIQPINMQGAGTVMVQSLQRGDIDAFIGWEPFESMAINQGLGARAEALDYRIS